MGVVGAVGIGLTGMWRVLAAVPPRLIRSWPAVQWPRPPPPCCSKSASRALVGGASGVERTRNKPHTSLTIVPTTPPCPPNACRAVLYRLRELGGLEETAEEGHTGSAVIAGLQTTVADRRARLEALLSQLLSTAVMLRRTDDGGGSLKVHAAVRTLLELTPSELFCCRSLNPRHEQRRSLRQSRAADHPRCWQISRQNQN
jgi:hypothetical protein